MYTQDERNLITLAYLDAFTYNTKHALLSRLKSNKPDFDKYESILIKTLPYGVYNKMRANYFDEEFRRDIFEGLERRGITCITYFSESYPERLKEIDTPPIVLFCKGDISLLKTRCFSVVGSRRTPPKTVADCKKICSELALRFTVVTGIAEGADTAALEGALSKGKAISVLAYGFDYAYPSINAQLIKRVADRGLIISEYPPDTQPKSFYFPVRNRIIAGLSEGTLVVSAAKRSGALITADIAVDNNRDVFAFPHSVGLTAGEGCNLLIKKGAYLAENILDIFSVYGLDFNTPRQKPLTDEERALYEAVCDAGEIFLPELAEKLGKQLWQLIPVISSLEIKNLVVRLGGNRYSAVK